MWLEKIIETKKAKNITSKMMSEKTQIPVETITRILHGKTEFPRIDTVLELGASVGLTPWELFSETTSIIGDKTEVDRLNTELALAQAEIAVLKDKVSALEAENKILNIKLEYEEKLVAVHNYYNNLKPKD